MYLITSVRNFWPVKNYWGKSTTCVSAMVKFLSYKRM